MAKKIKNPFRNFSFIRLSVKEQTFFAKRLSFLIKADVPILESLSMIREQTRSKGYQNILDHIIKDVSNGKYLSESLRKFKHIFGDFAINIIGVGESAGILSENLEYLSEELKKRHILRKKIVGAFIYPIVVTLATLAIVFFLMLYLFPKILPVFLSLHAELPLSTKILIFTSTALQNYWVFIIGAILFLVLAFFAALRESKKFHFYFDYFLLKIPIIKDIVRSYNLSNFTRTLGLLLKAGLTLSESIDIVSTTIENLVYKKEFVAIGNSVTRGQKLSVHLKKNRQLFPDILTQIVTVAERSGDLSNSFIYISELYESDVEDFTKNISTLIEPLLMILMGLMVGFIAISIITPIYSITEQLNPK